MELDDLPKEKLKELIYEETANFTPRPLVDQAEPMQWFFILEQAELIQCIFKQNSCSEYSI